MKLIDRYVAKTVLAAIGLVALMLAGLQLFILFVNQLEDLGRGDYGIVQAAFYVFLQMPYQVYLFFPMASLLGSLIGLGLLANNRELIVMRAAGVSIGHITGAVLKAALLLVIIVTLVGETLIPRLSYYANDVKAQAISAGQTLRTAHGVWLRHQNDFINIGTISTGHILENVYQYRFDNERNLVLSRRIDRIQFIKGAWQAEGVHETYFMNNNVLTRYWPITNWDVSVKPKVLQVSSSEPDEMTLHELKQYLRAQKNNHQNVLDYQLAYWQRIVQPFTTAVMMFLAIPFIFGPLRSSSMGSKLLAGATVGFGFYLINRFFGPVSQVLQWPPLLAAIGPTCVFALLGAYLMRRVR